MSCFFYHREISILNDVFIPFQKKYEQLIERWAFPSKGNSTKMISWGFSRFFITHCLRSSFHIRCLIPMHGVNYRNSHSTFSKIDTLHKVCICFLHFQVCKHPTIFLLFYIVAMDFVAFNILLYRWFTK